MEPERNLSRSGDEHLKWDPGQTGTVHVATPAILEALEHIFGADPGSSTTYGIRSKMSPKST